MKEFNAYLYRSSLNDIEHMVECIEQFKEFNLALKYTGREGFYSETIRLCKEELVRLIKKHDKEYDEKIDIQIISDKLKDIGMRLDRALKIIQQIENSMIDLSSNEQSFIESIKYHNKNLNIKQAEWLKLIYQRITN